MSRFSFASIVVAVGLTGCTDGPGALPTAIDPLLAVAGVPASPVVASATGSGHRVRNDRPLIFSFHATRRLDGSSSGRYYLDWKDLGPAFDNARLRVEVDVTCMSVRDGTAWVAGIITSVDGPVAREGTVSYFYVIDHGPAATDEISGLRLNDVAGEDQLFCEQQPLLLGRTPIERGNATVRSH
jgi:hypothetical protein